MATVGEVKARLKDLVGMNVYIKYSGVNFRSKYKSIITVTVESMGREFVKLAGQEKMRVIPNQRLRCTFGDSFDLFFSEDEAKDSETVNKIGRALMSKYPSAWSYDNVSADKMEAVAKILEIEY